MFAQCFVFVTFCAFTLTLANGDLSLHRFRGHVLKINRKYEIVTTLANSYKEPDSNVDNVLASGSWNQTYNITGWSVLEIKTSENQTNIDQVYSAGLLEGQFTKELTNMEWQNIIADVCFHQKHFCEKLKEFFVTQLTWIYHQIDTNPSDEYWHQVNLTLIQLNGLIDGYENKSRGPRKELDDPLGFFLFQVLTSLDEIAGHLGFQNISRHDHCSVLIKILPDFKDIFVSHVTWDDYSNLLKILKRYTMPLKRTPAANSTLIPGFDMIFSSYPGTLHSTDDFYMIPPTNLTVLETTLDIYKDNLYRNINPISVPEWMRVTIATRLANSGKEWVDNFYIFNDGTYNNEWMITDFKLFKPGTPPKSGFLTVTEQMTIYYQSADMTETLNNNSYWASYNNIYFPDFRNISGEEEMVKKKGPELYSWQNSSRAKIFQRDHDKVIDLPTMIHMMRYNDFKNDELSKCSCTPPYSSTLTISARCDLNDIKGKYPDDDLGFDCSGATDAKLFKKWQPAFYFGSDNSYEMMKDVSLVAIAGPTSDQQSPFIWSQSECHKQVPHFGLPDKWDFQPFVPKWVLS